MGAGMAVQMITRQDVLRLRDYYRHGYRKDNYCREKLVDIKTELVLRVMDLKERNPSPDEYKTLYYAISQPFCQGVLPKKLPSVWKRFPVNLFCFKKVLVERNAALDYCANKLEGSIKDTIAQAANSPF
ncbi:Uncharacterised protein [uncultured archaeon]|nr:Uncharacterised protein [uncultured archaeon]